MVTGGQAMQKNTKSLFAIVFDEAHLATPVKRTIRGNRATPPRVWSTIRAPTGYSEPDRSGATVLCA